MYGRITLTLLTFTISYLTFTIYTPIRVQT